MKQRHQHGRGLPQQIQADCLLMGRNALIETLRRCPERLQCIYTASSLNERGHEDSENSRRSEIMDLIRQSGLESRSVSRDQLRQLTGSDSHQGFVAQLKPRHYLELKGFVKQDEAETHGLVILLDSIDDPHNFGAILRAAECFGAKALIYSRNRGCGLTAVVSKSASGASELVPLIQVANLAESAEKLRTAGYWLTGADCGPESKDLQHFTFPEKTALILGSEAQGLHNLLQKRLDHKVRIRMYGQIDSLNVSQASAVLMAAYRRDFPTTPFDR